MEDPSAFCLLDATRSSSQASHPVVNPCITILRGSSWRDGRRKAPRGDAEDAEIRMLSVPRG